MRLTCGLQQRTRPQSVDNADLSSSLLGVDSKNIDDIAYEVDAKMIVIMEGDVDIGELEAPSVGKKLFVRVEVAAGWSSSSLLRGGQAGRGLSLRISESYQHRSGTRGGN